MTDFSKAAKMNGTKRVEQVLFDGIVTCYYLGK
jgi:hypothetical protein